MQENQQNVIENLPQDIQIQVPLAFNQKATNIKKSKKQSSNNSVASSSSSSCLETEDFEIQNGKRKFSCTLCSKSFAQFSYLVAHLRTIHRLPIKEDYIDRLHRLPFKCDVCIESFAKENSLRRHVKKAHKKKETTKK